jgi:hypothetical protein
MVLLIVVFLRIRTMLSCFGRQWVLSLSGEGGAPSKEEIDGMESVMHSTRLDWFQCEDACIIIECCCLIGNLAVLSPNGEDVTRAGGQRIVEAILRFRR